VLTDRPRPSAVLAAIRPTAARAGLAMVAITVVLASAPALVRSAGSRPVSSVLLVLAAVAAGAAVGWAADDPGRELLGSLPVPSSVRTAIRFTAAAVVSTAALVTTLVVASNGAGASTGQGARVPEALAAAALAAGFGLTATRRGEPATGPLAVIAGFGGVAVVGILAVRWPSVLPSFDPGPVHGRWWVLVVAGAALAVWAARDPGHR
jgi:hypothetical protein